MNGVRITPFAPAANLSVPTAVDLNMIPTIMIDHADVVTGGASAQWGSDAVGGVVNLIMRNNFNGFEVRGQTGQSTYGDNRENRIGLIAGTNFFGDKAHAVIAFDATNNTGMGSALTRPWGRLGGNGLYNSAGTVPALPAGTPTLLELTGIHSVTPYGGVISQAGSPLNNFTFTSPTTAAAFNHGTQANATQQIGGDDSVTPLVGTGGQMVPAVKKASLFSYLSYQVTPDIKSYLQLSYSYSLGVLDGQTTGYGGAFTLTGQSSLPITIACDNAYLDPAIRAQFSACSTPNSATRVTAFTYKKADYSIGGLGTTVTNTMPRVVAGLEGDLGKFIMGDNWHWDAHLTYGQNFYHGNYKNVGISGNGSPAPGTPLVLSHAGFASDAVVVTAANVGNSGFALGTTQCRALLSFYAANIDPNTKQSVYQPQQAAGCIPYNFFGPASSGNKSYLVSDAIDRVYYDLADVAFNLHGEPVSTWAGPVAVATGVEYRYEHEKNDGDAFANVNAYATSANDPSYSGQFNVIEGYVETNAPLAKDQFMIHALNVDGAMRYAHYSDVGNQFTWKVGVNFEPVEGVRFRATQSQDIRAPQIWELANPGSGQINTLSPCLRNNITLLTDTTTCAGAGGTGQTVPQNSTKGSPGVLPENASTTTLGFVIEPPSTWMNGWFSGFNASVDWYDITIVNAITNIQAATAVPACNGGQAYFCSLFTFNSAGIVTGYTSPSVNFGSVENIGYEFVLSYKKNLAEWGLPWAVRSSTSMTSSYIDHIFVNVGTPGALTIDRAGENGQNNQSTGASEPKLRANFNQTLDYDKASVSLQALFVSHGVLDNTYNNPKLSSTTISNNQVQAYWKLDLSASYMLTPHLQIFGVVNNLLDAWPAQSPYAVLSNYTSGAYYDKTGRAFTIGFDYKY